SILNGMRRRVCGEKRTIADAQSLACGCGSGNARNRRAHYPERALHRNQEGAGHRAASSSFGRTAQCADSNHRRRSCGGRRSWPRLCGPRAYLILAATIAQTRFSTDFRLGRSCEIMSMNRQDAEVLIAGFLSRGGSIRKIPEAIATTVGEVVQYLKSQEVDVD